MSRVDLAEALALLERGEVVGIPTETVYGLAGRIDSEAALTKIFSVKQRPFFDPLIVHVANLATAQSLCLEWPTVFTPLAEAFWPGPLTLIAPKKASVSSLITSGLTTVAVRCPGHPMALTLLRNLSFAAPSANRFGRTSPTTARHVEDEFGGTVPVLDGGPCTVGVESTVLSASETNGIWRIQILRPGAITASQIQKTLEKQYQFTIERAESVASPGHLKAHYQPESPVILLNQKSWSAEIQKAAELQMGFKLSGQTEMHLPPTPQQAARVLYEELRRLSTDKTHAITITRTSSQTGESWEAIWDRLERAATVII